MLIFCRLTKLRINFPLCVAWYRRRLRLCPLPQHHGLLEKIILRYSPLPGSFAVVCDRELKGTLLEISSRESQRDHCHDAAEQLHRSDNDSRNGLLQDEILRLMMVS